MPIIKVEELEQVEVPPQFADKAFVLVAAPLGIDRWKENETCFT